MEVNIIYIIMKAPQVTIGIPVYNAGRFIKWAVQSVLNQTYTDFELIITDDGSTDDTVKIVKSFEDPRIVLITDDENHGISYRLNQQIDLAQGKYFVRMDADDIMLPDRIEKQVAYLDSHPRVDVIGGGAIIIDDNNNIIGERIGKESMRIDLEAWIGGAGYIHPTVAGKTEVFKDLKYSTEFTGVEDQHLWMRASQKYKLLNISEYYIFYREPLEFKLKTYLFRRVQNRKLSRSREMNEILDKNTIRKRLLRSYLKGYIAIIITILHLDKKMIARRNKPYSGGAKFMEILKCLTSD